MQYGTAAKMPEATTDPSSRFKPSSVSLIA
jgi:hypothetical protein